MLFSLSPLSPPLLLLECLKVQQKCLFTHFCRYGKVVVPKVINIKQKNEQTRVSGYGCGWGDRRIALPKDTSNLSQHPTSWLIVSAKQYKRKGFCWNIAMLRS